MTTLAAYFHDLDPFIWRINGDFGIRWYGVSYLAGFVVAYLLLRLLSRRGWLAIPRDRIADAMMWMIGGVILGGRLGYLLVYSPELLTTFTSSPPFWGALALNQGGMASHGAIVGVILAAARISRGWKSADGTIVGRCSIWHVFDAMALACPAGLGFGRLANFINGELLGKVHSPPGVEGPWWTVRFPNELIDRPPPLTADQQVRLDALIHQAAPDLSPERGLIWLVEHAARFKAELGPLLSSRHPSQLYQAAAEGLILGIVLWFIWWLKPRRAGLIGCAFMIAYGILRILTEFWRLPDAQFGAAGRIYGLSRGQWLSVAMVAVGIVAAVIRLRRTPDRPAS